MHNIKTCTTQLCQAFNTTEPCFPMNRLTNHSGIFIVTLQFVSAGNIDECGCLASGIVDFLFISEGGCGWLLVGSASVHDQWETHFLWTVPDSVTIVFQVDQVYMQSTSINSELNNKYSSYSCQSLIKACMQGIY